MEWPVRGLAPAQTGGASSLQALIGSGTKIRWTIEYGLPASGVFLFRNTKNGGHDGSMPYTYARAYVNDALWIDCDR